jgi:hypothetical protein
MVAVAVAVQAAQTVVRVAAAVAAERQDTRLAAKIKGFTRRVKR